MLPIDLNTATYSKIARIPYIGPKTAKSIIQSRRAIKIRSSSNPERIIDANLTKRINCHVDLKDKKINRFSKD